MKNFLALFIITNLLMACAPIATTPTPEISASDTPIPATTPKPTKTVKPTETLTPTQSPPATETPTPKPCFQLLTPENGMIFSGLADTDKITFSWEPVAEAASYRIDVIIPIGQKVSFIYTDTSRDLFVQNLQLAGRYEWQVTALNANNADICSSDIFTFEKQ